MIMITHDQKRLQHAHAVYFVTSKEDSIPNVSSTYREHAESQY